MPREPLTVVPKVDMKQLSAAEFNRRAHQPKLPFHVTGITRKWKTERWTPDYLKSILEHRYAQVGNNDQGVFDYNQQVTGVVRLKTMPFTEAVDLITSEAGHRYYIHQRDIRKEFPELLRDIRTPELLDRWKVVDEANLWFGGKGCKTPLHFDQPDNFLVQVRGTKQVTLFPPEQVENLYPAVDDALPHCSRINVFSPDRDTFPLFAQAEPFRLQLELGPGDMLYIPLYWWHAMESLSVSISINFWWHSVL